MARRFSCNRRSAGRVDAPASRPASPGETNRGLLVSCYRRCLEVADELGAQTLAFPLISAGIYAWPLQDAVDAAVTTLRTTATGVHAVRIVAYSEATHRVVGQRLQQE